MISLDVYLFLKGTGPHRTELDRRWLTLIKINEHVWALMKLHKFNYNLKRRTSQFFYLNLMFNLEKNVKTNVCQSLDFNADQQFLNHLCQYVIWVIWLKKCHLNMLRKMMTLTTWRMFVLLVTINAKGSTNLYQRKIRN